LAGEVDLECAPALAGVVGADGLDPVPLDLADVSFVDVSGMRALRGGAVRPLAIIGASAPVSRLLALLAWDTDPAVEILEPA
jgi:anti-anti-sigma regulatory factor